MPPTATRKEYGPGDVIGEKYRLVQLLGEGGMGSVWVAENVALKANFALKLIRADVAEASANERFLSEARLAARLQHAAIVRVFDFGKTEHEEPYIVMELLEGETLGQRLSRLGSIDPVELCQMLLPIIDALHCAHGHGVIHRDLKPDNVFIAKTEGGVQPKLLDFGIAKLRGESTFITTKLTQAGTLIGSPDYMSPEQARGEVDLDPRSDVWALCVLAYECLVGKPPFHGDNYNALLWSIIHDEPVPITVFQAGDSELWRVLKTGFAKDRNARWTNAKKLGEAVAQWLESHGVVEDICNRSLHASWLPAERPTRPELTPFDESAMPPPHATQASYAALVPPPTLPGLRRPHTMSLWFAGLGFMTLVGALLLSNGAGIFEDKVTATPLHDSQVNREMLRAAVPHANAEDRRTEATGAAERREARPYGTGADQAAGAGEGIGNAPAVGAGRSREDIDLSRRGATGALTGSTAPAAAVDDDARGGPSAEGTLGGGTAAHGSASATGAEPSGGALAANEGAPAQPRNGAGRSLQVKDSALAGEFNARVNSEARAKRPTSKPTPAASREAGVRERASEAREREAKPAKAARPPARKKPVETQLEPNDFDFGI